MMGIYILIKGDEPIYVGRSKDIKFRLYGHRDKDYDYYVVIPTKPHRMKWMESMLISLLNPPLSKIQNWFSFQAMDENIDYLKNFMRRRHLVLYPQNSDRYYYRGMRRQFVDTKGK